MACKLDDMTDELVELLRSYAPFGEGFPAPTFKSKVTVMVQNSYKDGLHWKCLLIDEDGNTKEAFFFHEKRVASINNQEIEVILTPQAVKNSYKTGVEIHARIAY
jgi:single-stranded DNA-specific DHH superfamily exonuclease